MKRTRTSKTIILPRFIYALICAFIVAALSVSSGIAADKSPKATLVYEHALPNVPGKSIKGVLVEYGPIRTSVNNGPVVTYRAGQNFSEMPGDRHTLDENASKTEPAKLLAVFVVDTDEKELLTPLEK